MLQPVLVHAVLTGVLSMNEMHSALIEIMPFVPCPVLEACLEVCQAYDVRLPSAKHPEGTDSPRTIFPAEPNQNLRLLTDEPKPRNQRLLSVQLH